MSLAEASDDREVLSAVGEVTMALTRHGLATDADLARELGGALAESGAAEAMVAACSIDGEPRAVSISQFAEWIFGDPRAHRAADGLLRARGLSTATALPGFRVHWFFRNIEGLWACTKAATGALRDWDGSRRTSGRLYASPRIQTDDDDLDEHHRVLEASYCEQCGTTFFGGCATTSG